MKLETEIAIRYSEIGLKGQNRRFFEKALVNHIKRAAKVEGMNIGLRRIRGRVFVVPEEGQDLSPVLELLSRIPGIQSFSEGVRCERDIESLKRVAAERFQMEWKGGPVRFRVSAQRSDKAYELQSSEINAAVGAHLAQQFGEELKVNLKNAEIDVGIEVYGDGALVFAGRQAGLAACRWVQRAECSAC